MHCSSSKYIIFASFLISVVLRWGNVEGATRWQPSIIWDRFNPLLKCKCNWMGMAELQSYDRVELVCPTPYLVSEYRIRDISRALVYYKIYMRILNTTTHTMEQLQESLNNGSFCDPEHKETEVLHYCKQNPNKDDERFFKLRFNSFDEGDVAVVFSNTETGSSSDVNATTKHCSMAFVVNVTGNGERYDISYGKCLKPKSDANCSNIENPCLCDNPKTEMPEPTPETTPKPTTKTTTKTTPESTHTLEPTPTPTTKPGTNRPTKPSNQVAQSVEIPTNSAGRSGKTSDDSSPWKGLFWAVLVVALIELPLFVMCLKMKGKWMSKKNQTPPKELPKEDTADTAGNVMVTKNQTAPKELPKESKSDIVGYPNQVFEPSTPTAPPFEAGKDYNFTKTYATTNGRLPSVETRVLISEEKTEHTYDNVKKPVCENGTEE